MIEILSAEHAESHVDSLVDLLVDAVHGGASVGFMPPLTREEALAYWTDVVAAVRTESRVLLVATEQDRVLGSVQLALEMRRNGDHRAELIKLMVHSAARRRGVARALMHAAEKAAVACGRKLLLLDTRKGSEAEKLFTALGYIRFGEVPEYARSSNGALHTTSFFYRLLT